MSCLILDGKLIDSRLMEYCDDSWNLSDNNLKAFLQMLKKITSGGKMEELTDMQADLICDRISAIYDITGKEYDTTELRKKIKEYWSEKALSRPKEDTSKLVNNEEDYPSLSEGIGTIFETTSDRRYFADWAKRVLVQATVIDPVQRELVNNLYMLDGSMYALQNREARALAHYLKLMGHEIEEKDIYNGNTFLAANFDELMTAANSYFYTFCENGKYKGMDNNARDNFNRYLLLANFDAAVEKYADGIVSIDPVQKGSRQPFQEGTKYGFASLHVKQQWDDDFQTTSMGINTSRFVQQYISSLPEINADGILTGRNIYMRDFNNLVRIIKEHMPQGHSMIRENPKEALKEVMDNIKRHPYSFFTGNDRVLLNTFFTVYYHVFADWDDNSSSLYALDNAEWGGSKNNMFSMIVNHINKSASMDYVQTKWDVENSRYKVDYLSNVNLFKTKRDVSGHLTLVAMKGDMSRFREDYNVKFEESGGVIKAVEFTIPGSGGDHYHTINYPANKPVNAGGFYDNLEQDVKMSKETQSEVGLVKFFNDLFQMKMDPEFYEGIAVSNKRTNATNVYCLLNLAANMLAVNKVMADNSGKPMTRDIASRAFPEGTFNLDNTRVWFNDNLGCVLVEGFNNALGAVEVLARARSYISKDTTMSNVKNSEGKSLPKFGLTSLSESDKYLFGNLHRQIIKTGDAGTLTHNFFASSGNYRLISNVFKTEYVGSDKESRQVKSMSGAELIYDNIVSGYFANRNEHVIIQPAVYADKGRVQAKMVNMMAECTYKDMDGKAIVDKKPLRDLTGNDFNELYHATMRSQFYKLREVLASDYRKLFGALKDMGMHDGPIPDAWEDYEPLVQTLTDEKVYLAVKKIQNEGGDLTIIPEVHFSVNKGKYGFNNLLAYQMKMFLSDDRAEYDAKERIEDTLYAETIRMNGVRFATRLADGTKNRIITDHLPMEEDQSDYIRGKLSHLKDGGRLADKLLRDPGKRAFKDIWIDGATEEMKAYIAIDRDGNVIENNAVPLYDQNADNGITVILNPELYRFRKLDNVISANYNMATTGLPFLHKPKKRATERTARGIKIEEASRTVQFTKRGVIYGGTGHTLIKNKKDGIPQYLNLAVMDDTFEKIGTFTGDYEPTEIHNGAVHVSPFFAVWFRNSSPELNHSSIHEKPLGFSGLGRYGASTLLKCATFNITNSLMRGSTTSRIPYENMMREMTDRPWAIPNLDLSEELGEYYFIDPDAGLNKYYRIDNFKYEGAELANGRIDNRYSATVTEVTDRRQDLPGTERTVCFSVNSNYDLWKALGGAWSCSNVDGYLQPGEESVEEVARIANETNIYWMDGDKDCDDGTWLAFKDILDDPASAYHGRYGVIIDDPALAYFGSQSNILDVVPKKYWKQDGTRMYFQPMKYSDVHYQSYIQGAKNGQVNVNPNTIITNPVTTKISPSSTFVFVQGKLGLSTSKSLGHDFIEFDATPFVRAKLEGVSQEDTDDAIMEAIRETWAEEGRTVMFSDPRVLEAFTRTGNAVDEIYSMSEEDYMGRSGLAPEEAAASYQAIQAAIEGHVQANPDVKAVDATGHHLEDYLGSRLITSEYDPSYLVIQLTAEHDVENDRVSEMTQVISLLEQGSYTHDLAVKILDDIGRAIADRLHLYDKWDITTEEGKRQINTILGRSLCRVMSSSDDSISLGAAYLDEIRKELQEEGEVTSAIPFDDNNLISSFETNFRNGFNKDIIKRKFSGFAGVMTPTHDVYSIYDLDGKTVGIQDMQRIAEKNGTNTLAETLALFDADVPASRIQCGDWVEIGGKAYIVGTLGGAFDGQPSIPLSAVKAMRGQVVRKLGSKGRNLRAQNYFVTVEGMPPGEDNFFDLYDLDSILLASNLSKMAYTPPGEGQDYLSMVFDECAAWTAKKYGKDLYQMTKKGQARYVRAWIQDDMDQIHRNAYHMPIKYRTGAEYLPITSVEYQANELSVGKPFASKFLLDRGDTLADVNTDFFARKLADRRRNILPDELSTVWFVGNNYSLHFSYDRDIARKLREKGYKVSLVDTSDQIIYTSEGLMRRVSEGIKYPVTKGMKFYKVTDSTGRTTEVCTGFKDMMPSIWNTECFYTNNFRFHEFADAYDDPAVLEKKTGQLAGLLKTYARLNHVKLDTRGMAYGEMLAYAKGIDTAALDRMKAVKMNQSFKEALKVIAARIPAQSMQSFMNMKIAVFADTDTNIALSPLAMIFFEGSDFDIDKIYVMSSSIGDNGVYVNWSPYFMWDNDALFALSKRLPLPNGTAYANTDGAMDISGYNDVVALYDDGKFPEFLQRFTELLERIADETAVSGADERLLEMVNRHTLYQYDKFEAIKNRIFSNMYEIGMDPRNYLAQTVLLNIDIAREAAGRSTAGRFGDVSSYDNPGAKMVAQEENAVGKSSVGLYANGNKAFASLLVYYQEMLANKINGEWENFRAAYLAPGNTLEDGRALLERKRLELAEWLKTQEKDGTTLTDLEVAQELERIDATYRGGDYAGNALVEHYITMRIMFDRCDVNRFLLGIRDNENNLQTSFTAYDRDGNEFAIPFSPTLPNVNINPEGVLVELARRMIGLGLQEEVFDTLGVMINCSTDNAKELVLRPMNASGTMGRIYVYMAACGVPFDTITKFMTSDIVSLVSKKSLRSLFNEEDKAMDIDKAISFYLDGANIINFTGFGYHNSVIRKFIELFGKLGIEGFNKVKDEKSFRDFFKDADADTIQAFMRAMRDTPQSAFSLAPETNRRVSPEEMEDDIFYDDEGDDDIHYSRSKKHENWFLVNRFLKACLDRRNNLDSIKGNVTETLELLRRFSEGGSEISEYAQWCGINQGIDTMRNEFYNNVRKRERFISDRTGHEFSLMRFIKEPDYRQAFINIYERHKVTFNILAAIAYSPHFSKMYKAMAVNEDIMNAFSYKYRLFTRLADEVVRKKIAYNIDPRTMREIKRYIDDVATSGFFDRAGIRFPADDEAYPYYNENGTTTVRHEEFIDLSDVFGRASFKRIFERFILGDLREKFPGNRFLQDLMYGYSETPYGVRDYLKLPIDLNSVSGDLNESLFDDYVKGFNQIRGETWHGVPVEDLFFAYNLVVNNNSIGPKTLTRIFDDAVRDPKGTVIGKFKDYERALPGMELEYDVKDLFIRFAGNDNSGYTMTFYNGKKSILDGDGNRLDLFTQDNPAGLFSQKGVTKIYKMKAEDMYAKFLKLFNEGKLEIKLTCDE